MLQKNKGFTLIELLVVIAIIGILSAIVLASLSSARAKANDAKVEGQLTSMRNAAEIYNSTNSSYSLTAFPVGACAIGTAGSLFADTSSGMSGLVTAILGTTGVGPTSCNASAAAWAAGAGLPSDPTNFYWCVDSTGASKKESGTIASGTLTGLCP